MSSAAGLVLDTAKVLAGVLEQVEAVADRLAELEQRLAPERIAAAVAPTVRRAVRRGRRP